MNMNNLVWLIPLLIGLFILLPNVHAEKIIQNLDGGMDIEITYTKEIVVGREGNLSVLVKNNGWEDKQDISLVFSSQNNAIDTEKSGSITIKKLAQGGSYGGNIDLLVSRDASFGIHFLNLKYSHVLVANNENTSTCGTSRHCNSNYSKRRCQCKNIHKNA